MAALADDAVARALVRPLRGRVADQDHDFGLAEAARPTGLDRGLQQLATEPAATRGGRRRHPLDGPGVRLRGRGARKEGRQPRVGGAPLRIVPSEGVA